MKIPKYVDKALKLRTKYALLLDKQMGIVDDWLDNHNIECPYEDTHTGAEIYMNPVDSEERIREIISNYDKENNL